MPKFKNTLIGSLYISDADLMFSGGQTLEIDKETSQIKQTIKMGTLEKIASSKTKKKSKKKDENIDVVDEIKMDETENEI